MTWQSQHLILHAAPCLSSGFSLSLTLVSIVIIKWLLVCVQYAYACCCNYVVNSKHASDVRYSRCHNRARVNVGLSVGIGVTVSVEVVFTKNVV